MNTLSEYAYFYISKSTTSYFFLLVFKIVESLQCILNAEVPPGSIIGPTLFLLYINDLPDDVISNIAIYADDTTLFSKSDQASYLWQQLELPSELGSDL